jgi:hypothetical protein
MSASQLFVSSRLHPIGNGAPPVDRLSMMQLAGLFTEAAPFQKALWESPIMMTPSFNSGTKDEWDQFIWTFQLTARFNNWANEKSIRLLRKAITGCAATQLAYTRPEEGVSVTDYAVILTQAYHASKEGGDSTGDLGFVVDYVSPIGSPTTSPSITDPHPAHVMASANHWAAPIGIESFQPLTGWPLHVHRLSQKVALTTIYVPRLNAIRAYLTQPQDSCILTLPKSCTRRTERNIVSGSFAMPNEALILSDSDKDMAGLMTVLATWGRHLYPHPFVWRCPNPAVRGTTEDDLHLPPTLSFSFITEVQSTYWPSMSKVLALTTVDLMNGFAPRNNPLHTFWLPASSTIRPFFEVSRIAEYYRIHSKTRTVLAQGPPQQTNPAPDDSDVATTEHPVTLGTPLFGEVANHSTDDSDVATMEPPATPGTLLFGEFATLDQPRNATPASSAHSSTTNIELDPPYSPTHPFATHTFDPERPHYSANGPEVVTLDSPPSPLARDLPNDQGPPSLTLAPEQLPHSPAQFRVHLTGRQLLSLDQDDFNQFSHAFMIRVRKYGWLPARTDAAHDPHRASYNANRDRAGRQAFLAAVYPAI